MRVLPSGTVTLLFTDIEGSTRLLQEVGDAYAQALSDHRRLLRSVFDRHDGVEVSTEGDAFFVAFEKASDAVEAAVEIQAALPQAGPIRVRIGIHTGEPGQMDGDYVGIDVHRAARIAAAGHGGQILISRSTRALVDAGDLRDLGTHKLKDIGEIGLSQVGEAEFPPPRSLSQTNVPPPLGPLLGRQRELADSLSLIQGEGARLLTLTGPGGIGKTTLALEIARELLDSFDDGVWFVDLSPLRDPQLLASTIGVVVGAKVELAEHLRGRHALLVLDNFEQIIDAAGDVAGLLEMCPRVVCIVTSREALRVRGEHMFPVEPLDDESAAELFLRRARSVAPGFDADDQQLAALCARLESVPLAIELAAARVNVLSPGQLLSRLERRLGVLTGGARDAPERQRALEATIAWSYELLNESEQEAFRRLAVFVGGWSLEAAEAICEADLDTSQSLVDKSLVRAEEGRYRMLDTVREYALDRLDESGEANELRGRHAAYFADLAARAEPELTRADQHEWLERLAADHDNLRATLTWYAETPNGTRRGLEVATDLVFFWWVRGLYRDGLLWLERMLDSGDDERSSARAGALWGAGLLWAIVGEIERARSLVEEGLALARGLGDESRIARSFDILGMIAFFENDLTSARELFEKCIGAARGADDTWCLADALGTLGSIYPLQGEFALSKAAGSEGLDIARANGDRQGMRMALFGLALAAGRLGDVAAARGSGEEGLAICREIGDPFFASYFLWILATVELEAGDVAKARARAEESLRLARESEAPLLIVCALDAISAVSLAEGEEDRAVTQLEEADRIGRGGSVPGSYLSAVVRGLGEIAARRGDLSEAHARLEESLSLARQVDDLWAVARALAGLGTLAGDEGDVERAVGLLAAADALQQRLGVSASARERADLEEITARARAVLGSAYDEIDRAGRAMSLDDAAAYAARSLGEPRAGS